MEVGEGELFLAALEFGDFVDYLGAFVVDFFEVFGFFFPEFEDAFDAFCEGFVYWVPMFVYDYEAV